MEDINITIDDTIKIDTEDGDIILVTLPEMTTSMPMHLLDEHTQRVTDAFTALFKDKDVKIAVMQYGMKVEFFKGSNLADKN